MAGRIGFVDDCLDNFHADVYLQLLRGELADLGFTVTGCTALQREPSRAWAQANAVTWFDSVQQLDDHVDHYIILAPSTPQTHLPLCEQVFERGKSTYVDKTFAPDLATAERIFALADEHGVAVQTTSALRYTEVQQMVESADAAVHHMIAWGGGSSFDEYAIHPVEMVVSCLGENVSRVMCWGDGDRRNRLLLEWTHGATAIVHVHTDGAATPFAAAVSTDTATSYVAVDSGPIFSATARAFLQLFDSGIPNVPRGESLMVHRILDAVQQPDARIGFVEI
ncbi:MAG: Gfo/Idh/MocA family oxidoreductase [Gemmatimonadetes bacterium]|nr:Gfo/Idh/MocA family oxidoreductase [Gemmatimonadota bacterium]MBT5587906.1 Gfo/Idh/MocA family oxidoreductase [Gemmatimonadota bacterium]